jgi:glutamyl-tRNA synthetase
MSIRTRVAPSPTGDPHVGTAYVALFNYCLAKQAGGEFILRIEDTDRARSSRESEQMIMDAVRWTGITWDEGPDIGGPYGPYRQSERGHIYLKHANDLLESDHAFRCFWSDDDKAAARVEWLKGPRDRALDSPFTDLSKAQSDAKAAAGESFVIRLRVPREGDCEIQDRLRGTVTTAWTQIDQQVLLKSDGMPTYHLANVVDDHLMRITHVMRGEEWIPSAPKHQLLYAAFGWDMPELVHLPLLRNPDKSKLSKRKNPTSILYYERMGVLPQGLLNYLGRMAWSMPDESEMFDLATMVENFDLDRISLGGPIFDVTKLEWLNGKWIREALDDDALAAAIAQWALKPEFIKSLLPLVRERINHLSDLPDVCGFMFQGLLNPTAEDLAHKKLEPDVVKQALHWALVGLDAEREWNAANIQVILRRTAKMMDLKLRDFLAPFFIALSGKPSATPLFQTMDLMGRDMTRARLRQAVDALGGVGKKLARRWEKAYEAAMAALEAEAAAEAAAALVAEADAPAAE